MAKRNRSRTDSRRIAAGPVTMETMEPRLMLSITAVPPLDCGDFYSDEQSNFATWNLNGVTASFTDSGDVRIQWGSMGAALPVPAYDHISRRLTGESEWQLLAIPSDDVSEYIDTTAERNTQYDYLWELVYESGTVRDSDEVTITTPTWRKTGESAGPASEYVGWPTVDGNVVMPVDGQTPGERMHFTEVETDLPQLENTTLEWGDFDSDGDLDLLLCGQTDLPSDSQRYTINVCVNRDGQFDTVMEVYSGSYPRAATWGDFDSDGDLDILPTMQVEADTEGGVIYRNDGGSFAEAGKIDNSLTSYLDAAWGDLDSDGDLDVAVLKNIPGSSNNALDLYYNSDTGTLTAGDSFITSSATVNMADVDADGDLDLVTDRMTAYINGFAAFTGPHSVDMPTSDTPYSDTVWMDWNNDGTPDAAGFSLAGDTDNLECLTADGAGKSYGLFGNQEDAAVALGDLDNDGMVDVVSTGKMSTDGDRDKPYYTGYNATLVACRDADGGFWQTELLLPGVTNGDIAIGDYDSDGDMDIVIAGEYENSGTLKLYRNDGTVSGCDYTIDFSSRIGSPIPAEYIPAGLSYNMRVGTALGSEDVMAGNSDLGTGERRIVARGNVDSNTSWMLRGLTPGQTYYYAVQTVDGAYVGSAWSQEQSFTVPESDLAMAAPGGLFATMQSDTQIDLTWQDTTDDEIGFTLLRRKGVTGVWAFEATLPPDTTSYSDTDLPPHTSYFYRIHSQDADNDLSVPSNVAYAATPNAVPVANPDVMVLDEDASISFNVTDNDTDADGDVLIITDYTLPEHGQLVLHGQSLEDGFDYVPDENYNGTDGFTYSIDDCFGGQADTTVDITVTAVNDMPTVEGVTLNRLAGQDIRVVLNAGDVETALDDLVFTFDGLAFGTMTKVAPGEFIYSPGQFNKVEALYESFEVTVTDSGDPVGSPNDLTSAPATITIDGYNMLEFGGRKAVTYTDADGDLVTISLKGGGEGRAYLHGFTGVDIRRINLTNTTSRSSLRIKTKGRDSNTSVGEIRCWGSMNSVSAGSTDLLHWLALDGTLRTLQLRNVAGSEIVTNISGLKVGPKDVVSMTLGRVTDSMIQTNGQPIKSLSVTEWIDTDGDDTITTPWIGKIASRGVKGNARKSITGIAGDFQAGLNLFAGDSRGMRMRIAGIAGDLGGNWNFENGTGNVGSITALSATDWRLIAPVSNVTSLSFTGDVSGEIVAGSIGSISTKGLTANARRGVTAMAGDLKADMIVLGTSRKGTSIGKVRVAGDISGTWTLTRSYNSSDLPTPGTRNLGAITALSATDWRLIAPVSNVTSLSFTGEVSGEIVAGSIGSISTKGRAANARRGVTAMAGDLKADMIVLGTSRKGTSIGKVRVAGDISGTWTLTRSYNSSDLPTPGTRNLGAVTALSATGWVLDAPASNIKSLMFTGNATGDVRANSIDKITTKGRRGNAKRKIAAMSGDLGLNFTLLGANRRGESLSCVKAAGKISGTWSLLECKTGNIGTITTKGGTAADWVLNAPGKTLGKLTSRKSDIGGTLILWSHDRIRTRGEMSATFTKTDCPHGCNGACGEGPQGTPNNSGSSSSSSTGGGSITTWNWSAGLGVVDNEQSSGTYDSIGLILLTDPTAYIAPQYYTPIFNFGNGDPGNA